MSQCKDCFLYFTVLASCTEACTFDVAVDPDVQTPELNTSDSNPRCIFFGQLNILDQGFQEIGTACCC